MGRSTLALRPFATACSRQGALRTPPCHLCSETIPMSAPTRPYRGPEELRALVLNTLRRVAGPEVA